MGKLKPIGSEKLEGLEKIQRIMEIARYNENIPNPINEVKSNHYNIKLVDGNTYHIEKEKNGYVIKKTVNESQIDYVEPMKNRKYYQSYSQAFKRLNLIVKEINDLYGNDSNVSLFGEQKKFVLKTPKPEPSAEPMDSAPSAPAPAPPPSTDIPSPEMPSPDGESDMPPMPDDEMPDDMDDMSDDEMPDDMDGMGDEETPEDEGDDMVSFKTIQKLTGKLAQKLRKLNQGEEPISSDDTKYVLNSVLSALDLSVLSDEDIEDIISKLEDSELESDDETEEPSDDMDDMGDEEIPDDEDAPPPPSSDEELPEFEMTEEETNEYLEGMIGGAYDLGFSDTPKKKSSFNSKLRTHMGEMMEDDEIDNVSNIFDGVFSESKIDNIIKSYFVETENEKKFIQEQKQKKFLTEKAKKVKVMREVKTLSESYQQESISSKFLDRYTKARFIGKTNKKNLVFEVNGKQYKITPDGAIL
jgi:hypothetical protein